MLLTESKTADSSLRKRKFVLFLIIITVFFASAFLLKNQIINFVSDNIITRTYIKSLGIGGVNRSISPVSLANHLSRNIIDRFKENVEFEPMIIDIKFENFIKLKENREYALKEGMLNKTHFENVRGKLRVGEKKVKANIRLKGWYLDHVATDKWSLRMKIKDDNIEGIREFSINGPYTRDFQSSPLINEAMRYKGVLAPRDKFYKVILNGKNLGIMYFEEKYSEQFTDNAGTPFGPILDYDEKINQISFLDEEKFWKNDPNLRLILTNLESILRNPESYIELLDQNLWAEYLAVTFLFKCFHGNTQLNLSYYFHPLDKTLQPISSDNACGQKDYSRELGFLPFKNEFIYKLIGVESFKKILTEKIMWWYENEEALIYIDRLQEREKVLRRGLSKESPFLGKFSISNDHLDKVINWIHEVDKNYAYRNQIEEEENKVRSELKKGIIPSLEIKRKEGKYLVGINDFSSDRYILKELIFKSHVEQVRVNLEGTKNFSGVSNILNEVGLKNYLSNVVEADLMFLDLGRGALQRTVQVDLSYAQLNSNPFISSSKDTIKKYFNFDENKNLFYLDIGKSIEIYETLIFPENFDLLLEAGSKIEFHKNSGLVVRGNLTVNGTKTQKVNLSGYESGDWSGVLILAKGKKVFINNLIINGGNGIIKGIPHRGAFTISNAVIKIENSSFKNNLSEDALNLVQVKGSLENISIQNTPSDGLDIDYGEVSISNSKFINIGTETGADAIDMSKSNVNIKNVKIRNVTDKGISIGEGSHTKISDLIISSAFVGIVAKDSSNVIAQDVSLKDIVFADTMSFRKKTHFDGASLKITNLNTSLDNHITQNMSSTSINGKEIEPEDVDIDALYDDVMKSVK